MCIAARIARRIFLPHLTIGRMNMFIQKPDSFFLRRFWTFELLYSPIVLPSLKNSPIEIEPGAASPNKPSPIKVPALPADAYIEIQPGLSPKPSCYCSPLNTMNNEVNLNI
jgi:hypothetical protein